LNKFSLLTCVYAKENPRFFSQCVDSVLAQTSLPDEWVIVKDGPLTGELDSVIDNMRFPNELNVVGLPQNVTQGPARAVGLKAARHDWIAIMDSDDVCTYDRFEKQLDMIKGNPKLDLIGGQMSEFADCPEHIIATRTVPTDHNSIIKFVKKRNPFNAMTVMFKRGLALESGNYRYFPWFEDYDLWSRMIKNGAICANHKDVLVYARIGGGMYSRRRGLSYVRSEWRMQRELKALGLISGFEFAKSAALRLPVRLLPARGVAAVYNRYVRDS
jgi:glycosyltransferase involved in cell wall biosynthesis